MSQVKICKHGMCIGIGLIMILSIFPLIHFKDITTEDALAGSKWLETTEIVFSNGTLDNVTVNGSGEDATVKLAHYGDNPPSATPWYGTDWKYRRPVTIDNTNGFEALTDYQVNISIPYSSGIKSDFSDLRFTGDDGVTIISYWIQRAITSTYADVWVKVPSIPAVGDTIIYMYYGNPNVSSVSNFDTTFTKDFGDENLVALWHMDEGNGTTVFDESGNGNTGTIYGATWVGEDGGRWEDRDDVGFSDGDCLSFDGVDDYISIPSHPSFKPALPLSISLWVEFHSLDETSRLFYDAANDRYYGYWINVQVNGAIELGFGDGGIPAPGSRRSFASMPGTIIPHQLYHIVGIIRGSTDMNIYINGINISGGNYGGYGGSIAYSNNDAIIGCGHIENTYHNGLIDEVRIYDRALSEDEIRCHYERRKHTWPEPEDVVGSEQGQYHLEGNFISSAIGSEDIEKNWDVLEWATSEALGMDIVLQLRSAETITGLSNAKFVGPDGSTDTYYTETPDYVWEGHDLNAWIQYKVYLSSTNILETPALEDVTIKFNCIPDVPVLVLPKDDEWSTDNTPLIEWTFSDTDGTQKGFQLLIDDDIDFNDVDYDSDEQDSMAHLWQFPTGTRYSEIDDGIWYWKVRTKDDDGDWGPYSASRALKVDTAAPESFSPTVEPSGWTTNRQPKVTFSTTDAGCGLDRFEVNVDGTGFSVETSPYVLPELVDGVHDVTIRVIDKVGNFRDEYVDVFIDTTPPDGFSPSTNWSSWRSDRNPEISFSTVDGGSGLDRYEVKVMEGSYSVQTSPYTLPPQSDGQHRVVVRAFDVAGNYMDGEVDVFIDTTPPKITHAPVVNCTEGEALFITAMVSDELSGVSEVMLYFKNGTQTDYTPLEMESEGGIFSAMLLENEVTPDGLKYFIKAVDGSSPANANYYGYMGQTNTEPITTTDIDVKVETVGDDFPDGGGDGVEEEETEGKTNESALSWFWIAVMLMVIIVVMLLVIIIILKRRDSKSKVYGEIEYQPPLVTPSRMTYQTQPAPPRVASRQYMGPGSQMPVHTQILAPPPFGAQTTSPELLPPATRGWDPYGQQRQYQQPRY